MRRRALFLIGALLALAAFVAFTPRGHRLWVLLKGGATVEERLNQYGPAARERLLPAFKAAGVRYPAADLKLVAIKNERLLQVYAMDARANGYKFIKSYPILAASGVLGPKLQEGDKQVPEGVYRIADLNPNSRFHLALWVAYPNTYDRLQAVRENRTNLGGDIMVHGGSSSVGCLAMGDPAIEEIFTAVAETGLGHTTLVLSPWDMRYVPPDLGPLKLPPWTRELYNVIRLELIPLPDEEARYREKESKGQVPVPAEERVMEELQPVQPPPSPPSATRPF
ncbi:MAG: L,D-transpeptidase family protein [Planctomycetes bacterium]|nr:L,D-transpeptidase family protein [Planctomycetota bacterium]